MGFSPREPHESEAEGYGELYARLDRRHTRARARPEEVSVSTDESKAIVQRWFSDVVSRGDMESLGAICAVCASTVRDGARRSRAGPLKGFPVSNLITSCARHSQT